MKIDSGPLSENVHLLGWVRKRADLCQPDAIRWIDGSERKHDALCATMVKGGTFIELYQKKWPGCHHASFPSS